MANTNLKEAKATKNDELGLKELVSTSYSPEPMKYKTPYRPSLFEQEAPQCDLSKAQVEGKMFILERDHTRTYQY